MKTIIAFVIAAEVLLPIRARIIDCSTIEKARYYCEREKLCCDILERKLEEERMIG